MVVAWDRGQLAEICTHYSGRGRVRVGLPRSLTLAASSGVISLIPWASEAWAAAFFKSSSSVAASAVNGHPGISLPQARRYGMSAE